MTERTSRISWPLLAGAALVGACVVARAMPETTEVGRMAREIEARARDLPAMVTRVRLEARLRLAAAREAFRAARAESEQALVIQFEEAKKRVALE